MKKILIIALILVFALQLMPFTASAADAPTQLWVEPSDTNGIPARIDVFKMKTGGTNNNPTYTYQVYLPGNAVPANCFLSWDGGATVTINGTTYESGACPLPQVGTETTYEFKNGNQSLVSLKIVVYQGSPNVQSVFIEIDESLGTIAAMDNDINHNTVCSGTIYINGVQYELTKMKGRGNATWTGSEDKKPYNITLGKKINFPGINSEKTKKWSFLAEITDHSLLSNRSGYHLAYELGIGQDTTSADVWMNGEYQGCYTVTPKTDSFVTTDGFMIEQDNYKEVSVAEGGDPQFTLEGLKEASGWSSCYNRITVKKMGDNLLGQNEAGEVDESPANLEAKAAAIQAWLQEAWDAIRSDDGYNSSGKYYTDYIDIESFAKMYLMHEYAKSYDVCAGSILFHRDGTSDEFKLIAGPMWDLDNAMGSTCQNSSLGKADDRRNGDRRSAQGHFIPNVTEYKTSIYKTISNHSDFMEEVIFQYNKYRSAFDNLENDVAAMISDIADSARMNHIKVNDISGTYKNVHKYSSATTLGSGEYRQTYLATTNSKTDWANYAANLKTYISVRSLWFRDWYVDPDYVDPADCTHEYEVIENHPASCTRSGSITYKCPHCRDTYTEVLAQFPHDYQDGVCTVCRETLLDVSISCAGGASVTVYETKGMTGPCIENATLAHPRNGDTGLIDCSGDGQVNFVVDLLPGYMLESVAAEPAASYKNLKLPADTGIENGYRITQVKGNLTITVRVSGTVTFNANGGTGEMEAQPVTMGGEATLPKNGFTRTGYTFVGWNTKADGSGTAYADGDSVSLNENTTLYAQWTVNQYTIKFDTAGGSTITKASYDYGAAVATPDAPTKEGYTFAGWSPALPVTMPAEDLEVTAQWTINQYTLTFDTAGGSAVEAITADYGAPVTAPAAPTRTGYTFDGWDKAIPTAMPAEDLTITAKWTINQYTISFDTAGGSAVEDQTVTYLGKAVRPEDPTKEGYEFLHWADQDGRPFSFETLIVDDVALTAVWHEHIPTITGQPENQTVSEGKTAAFAVTASGEGLSYQRRNATGGGRKWYKKSGATSSSYTVTARASYDGMLYCCVVKNSAGGSVTSDAATLTVIPKAVITLQPADQTAAAGKTATFTTAASGEGLSYQWQYYSNEGKKWHNKTGATSAAYTVKVKASFDGMLYRCKVTNAAGGAVYTAEARLTVLPKPVITLQPADQTAAAGKTATFTAAASGGVLSYQWQYSADGGESWHNKTGATSAAYTVTVKASYDGMLYRCKVTNSGGSVYTAEARLTVLPKPVITAQPAGQTAAEGKTATFTVTASGEGLSYQWQYSKDGGNNWYNKSGATSASYTVTAKASYDGMLYRCKVTNSIGKVCSSAAELTVK
jgi:uncharacterized repeat protein (TIGR02543 family)